MSKGKAIVITTEHKGVFFGYGDPALKADKTITATQVRMCVHWSESVRGVLGLAATGPDKNCRITPAVPSIALSGVTAIMECSEAAVKAWEAGPWN